VGYKTVSSSISLNLTTGPIGSLRQTTLPFAIAARNTALHLVVTTTVSLLNAISEEHADSISPTLSPHFPQLTSSAHLDLTGSDLHPLETTRG
jgi:hypothetical protein